MKYPMTIMAVVSDTFPKGITKMASLEEMLPSSMDTDVVFAHRERLDVLPIEGSSTEKGDSRFRQLLPYISITSINASGERVYFAYRRAAKGEGEARLKGQVSIGLGGHIDFADAMCSEYRSVVHVVSTVMGAAIRELNEELHCQHGSTELEAGAMVLTEPWAMHTIKSVKSEVDELHLGLSFVYEVDNDMVFSCRETHLETLGWMTAKELAELPVENWSADLLAVLEA